MTNASSKSGKFFTHDTIFSFSFSSQLSLCSFALFAAFAFRSLSFTFGLETCALGLLLSFASFSFLFFLCRLTFLCYTCTFAFQPRLLCGLVLNAYARIEFGPTLGAPRSV